MTPERLAKIRAREQAATPGPWLRDFDNAERPVIYVPLEVKDCVSVLFEADWGKEADADFAAHARADIPDLLSEVERLTVENAQLKDRPTEYHCATCGSMLLFSRRYLCEDCAPSLRAMSLAAEVERLAAENARLRDALKAAGVLETFLTPIGNDK